MRAWRQFSLLALLSFVASFGVSKSLANLFAGRLCDRFGRRRVLLSGWALGLAEPLLIVVAPNWTMVVVANLLLGIQQGICWTTAITMMVDRSRSDSHGLATGINEFAGYVGSAVATLAAGLLAARYGLRPVPFLPSVALLAAGFLLTLFTVTDTVRLRIAGTAWLPLDVISVAFQQLHRNRALLLCSQCGLVINLFQALVTVLLPVFLRERGVDVAGIGLVLFAYTFTWGIAQGVAGAVSDHVDRRLLIAAGMAGQGIALLGLVLMPSYTPWLLCAVLMGAARALAYPTLLAAVADSVKGRATATALGVYRFYRDSGFWVGGLAGGAIADLAGIPGALLAASALMVTSGGITLRMPVCT